MTLEACPESQVKAPVALKGCWPALPIPKAIGPLSHRLLAAFHLGNAGYLLREGSRALAGELASACAPGEGDPSRATSLSTSVRNHRYSMYLITLNYCWDSL